MNTIYQMLDAIERHKSLSKNNILVIPEPYGSRVFLFDKLFIIVDTNKKQIFIEPPKNTKPVMKYTQAVLDYYGLDDTIDGFMIKEYV